MTGGPDDFDRYCDQHAIQPGEEPAAFAAWLHELTGGGWDGEMRPVSDDDGDELPRGQYGPTADYSDG